ncbi:MAG: undecaprenyldiphospho-muramoylpentapeptide beta-N-acetylglucosaminyltransferase [Hyphomicrobiaceae bacterium]
MARSIMLAAGGTGGHLFPAFALADELAQRGFAVDLATDARGERFKSEFNGRAIYQIPSATTTSRSPVALTKTAFTLANGVRIAHKILREARPQAVVGFGGYPSFPPIVAAALRSVPTIIHEQNALLGRANRMLAKRVGAIATSFKNVKFIDDELAKKVHLTGNPVRPMVLENAVREYQAPDAFGPIHLLVFGGSQGAKYFADIVPAAVAMLPDALRVRILVMQQCRGEDVERVRAAYADAGVSATCESYFADLPRWMAQSHLVIARGGAATVAELTVIGCPSVLVPYAHSIENDQLENARVLADAGAAWCIEQKSLNSARLADELVSVCEMPGELVSAANAARALGRPHATSHLADVVEQMVGQKPQARPK